MGKIHVISLKLNFTPNTLGCCWLSTKNISRRRWSLLCIGFFVLQGGEKGGGGSLRLTNPSLPPPTLLPYFHPPLFSLSSRFTCSSFHPFFSPPRLFNLFSYFPLSTPVPSLFLPFSPLSLWPPLFPLFFIHLLFVFPPLSLRFPPFIQPFSTNLPILTSFLFLHFPLYLSLTLPPIVFIITSFSFPAFITFSSSLTTYLLSPLVAPYHLSFTLKHLPQLPITSLTPFPQPSRTHTYPNLALFSQIAQ